jgi:hypothetical protein
MNENSMRNLKLKLEVLAKRDCWYKKDDLNIIDRCGGNFDDAYSGGFSDGESALAEELLLSFFPNSSNSSDESIIAEKV